MTSRLWHMAREAAGEIRRHKSFLILILAIMGLDRLLKWLLPSPEALGNISLGRQSESISIFLFEHLPGLVLALARNPRVIGLLFAGFLLKEVLSLWPSSDMRRMHREERRGFGILGSLAVLRIPQVVWDMGAVALTAVVVGGWAALSISLGAVVWHVSGRVVWTGPCAAAFAGLLLPSGMAAFSYSSKIAVMKSGTWQAKFAAFAKVFASPRIALPSWLFYAFRMALEVTVLGLIPIVVHYLVDWAVFRVALVSVLACPVYAYLKMLSFKFFLRVYRSTPIVAEEYAAYYGERRVSRESR